MRINAIMSSVSRKMPTNENDREGKQFFPKIKRKPLTQRRKFSPGLLAAQAEKEI